MSTVDFNCSVLICFFVPIDILASSSKFTSLELPIKIFSELVATAAVPVAKEIMARMEVRLLRRKSALKESEFLKSEDLELHKLGAE